MKSNWTIWCRFVGMMLMLNSCHRSTAVHSSDTETESDTADTIIDVESDTGSDSFVDTPTDTTVETEPVGTDVADSIGGAWLVNAMFQNGAEIPVEEQYAFSWEEDGQSVAMNVVVFADVADDTSIDIDGMCSAYPCYGSFRLFDNGSIELELYKQAMSSVVIPPEMCPEACSQWIDKYLSVMNSVTGYEIDGEQLVLHNNDHSNKIYFSRSSITLDNLPL